MKELKFRAWNPKTQSYAWPYPESFYIIGEVTVFDMLKQLDMSVIEYNDLVIEQYVGVKDSEGVEIYEGDILEIRNRDRDTRNIVVGAFGEPTTKYTNYNHVSSLHLLEWHPSTIKVIGNIKQNPELKGAE